jgi:murein DD-endopeptidase MepM/ murein hydrolase activator NlpD
LLSENSAALAKQLSAIEPGEAKKPAETSTLPASGAPSPLSSNSAPAGAAASATASAPAAVSASGSSAVGEIETFITSIGLDLEHLLGRPAGSAGGQGGPFIGLNDPSRSGGGPLDSKRKEELQKLVRTLPLSAPLQHFRLESPFGSRTDPFNRRQAFHSGIDLSAPFKTPVMVTAPGRVVFAGSKDEYGRMVEIDHGMGISTRYAHLHRITVTMGQKLKKGDQIGLLGSTGRSSGPHVHYEVLVNGVPHDPEKFLQAGKNVLYIKGN